MRPADEADLYPSWLKDGIGRLREHGAAIRVFVRWKGAELIAAVLHACPEAQPWYCVKAESEQHCYVQPSYYRPILHIFEDVGTTRISGFVYHFADTDWGWTAYTVAYVSAEFYSFPAALTVACCFGRTSETMHVISVELVIAFSFITPGPGHLDTIVRVGSRPAFFRHHNGVLWLFQAKTISDCRPAELTLHYLPNPLHERPHVVKPRAASFEFTWSNLLTSPLDTILRGLCDCGEETIIVAQVWILSREPVELYRMYYVLGALAVIANDVRPSVYICPILFGRPE
jgi:hypothetical protein